MRLTGLSNSSLNRLRKRAQWDVDESGQAVPMGSPGAQGDSSDMSSRLTTLEQMVQQYGATFQEWVDYLSQYNQNLSESINEIWTDVNTIGNDVDQMRFKQQPQQKPSKGKAWETYTQTAKKAK